MKYEEDYAYMVFMYGDLFKNILQALREGKKEATFHIPTRYKDVTHKTVQFHNKWFQKEKIYYETEDISRREDKKER